MQRYFIHLHNKEYTPKDATMLLERARRLARDVIVRDSRVSKKYIEFDTSVPDDINVDNLVSRIQEIAPVASVEHIMEKVMPKDEAIRHAIELFNDEKYWGAHESLEGVWKATPNGRERDLINGLILVSAAFVHDQKDERDICLSILDRAMKKIDDASGVYHNIDLDRVARLVRTILKTGRVERFTI